MNIALNVPFLMLTMISVRHLIGWYSGTGFENMGIQSAKQLEEKTLPHCCRISHFFWLHCLDAHNKSRGKTGWS